MTDEDTVRRAAKIMGVSSRQRPRKLPSGKMAHRLDVYGQKAFGWAQTLYTLMSSRRQEQIRQMLDAWHAAPGIPRSMKAIN